MSPQRPKNRVNESKRPPLRLNPGATKAAGIVMQVLSVTALIIFALFFGWKYIYKIISESYRPNAQVFNECKNSFIQIKTKPTYGIVLKTSGDVVDKLYLTAPDGTTGIKAIELEIKDRVVVYFSSNFNITQIGEFLRLSKLERGSIDYCYVMEQISLTSGVPIEYVIVDDQAKGLSSSVSIAQSQDILSKLDQITPSKFNKNLLPERLLDDATKVQVVTYETFKEQFPDFFKIDEISQEQAFVEVYNATNIDGYASIISRKWSMLGIDITRVGNTSQENPTDINAIMYVKNEQSFSRTIAMIKSTFPQGKLSILQGRPAGMVTTGDIVVILLKR